MEHIVIGKLMHQMIIDNISRQRNESSRRHCSLNLDAQASTTSFQNIKIR